MHHRRKDLDVRSGSNDPYGWEE